MPKSVILPQLGQTVESSTIVKWHKQPGDTVHKGEVLFEVETDKAVLEAESFHEGTLLKILVPEGREMPVRSVVAYIGEPGEECPEAPPPPVAAPKKAPARPEAAGRTDQSARERAAEAPASPPTPRRAAQVATPETERDTPTVTERPAISPRARALARERAIDPAPIVGSGPGGRVVERDIREHLEARGYADLRITPAALNLAREQQIDVLTVRAGGEDGRIRVEDVERAVRCKPQPMSRMRRIIAQRLSDSFATIPHFYVTVTVDLTDLAHLRADLKAAGQAFSINDFVMQAVVLAVNEYPAVNSTTDGEAIAWRGDVDLGVAVSLDNGLVVPVVRAAQLLTFSELSERARDLVRKAREGKLSPDDMQGGSITVSNMGMLNVDQFNAIINPGEAAILAIASARDEPAVVDGEIRVRTRMRITLSADHRVVDGATGAAFVNFIKQKIEDMSLWKSLTLL